MSKNEELIAELRSQADGTQNNTHAAEQAMSRAADAIEALEAKLEMPCGSCHPCTEWANQTWINAGLRLPHVIDWQETVARAERAEQERAAAREALAQANKRIDVMLTQQIAEVHDRFAQSKGDTNA